MEVQRAIKQMLVCIAVIGLIMAIDFAVFSLWDQSGGLMTSLCLSVAILPWIVVMLIWLLYLRWQSCNWITQQPHSVDECHSGHIHGRRGALRKLYHQFSKCLNSYPHHQQLPDIVSE